MRPVSPGAMRDREPDQSSRDNWRSGSFCCGLNAGCSLWEVRPQKRMARRATAGGRLFDILPTCVVCGDIFFFPRCFYSCDFIPRSLFCVADGPFSASSKKASAPFCAFFFSDAHPFSHVTYCTHTHNTHTHSHMDTHITRITRITHASIATPLSVYYSHTLAPQPNWAPDKRSHALTFKEEKKTSDHRS